MLDQPKVKPFETLNHAYNKVFQPGQLSLGLIVPIEAYPNALAPTMADHMERAQQAEALGFSALWLRDVPFNVPSFGDAGQMFDPFVYLGALSVATRDIGLGVASVILPLRHPAHVAKAAATADQLSGGRLLLGIASGDRPDEYPAMSMGYETRAERFRDSVGYIRAIAGHFPQATFEQGHLRGDMDMLPKPTGARLPLLVTGGSRQSPEWVAAESDGWITYPRDPVAQGKIVSDYRARARAHSEWDRPVMQSLYIDLLADAEASPRPIHLGFASGTRYLLGYLKALETSGVNHVALNLRFNRSPMPATLDKIAAEILQDFSQ
ncbi:MAG: TIGR03571 family LLM class oxidoreductase [Pseudomonadota bacterium]